MGALTGALHDTAPAVRVHALRLSDKKALIQSLERIARLSSEHSSVQFAALAGFLDALDRRGTPLLQFQTEVGVKLEQTIQKLDALFTQARADATPPTATSAG